MRPMSADNYRLVVLICCLLEPFLRSAHGTEHGYGDGLNLFIDSVLNSSGYRLFPSPNSIPLYSKFMSYPFLVDGILLMLQMRIAFFDGARGVRSLGENAKAHDNL